MLPRQIHQLVQLLTRLPSVGEKTAQRFALHFATADAEGARLLADALQNLAESTAPCERCGHVAEVIEEVALCSICADGKRDGSTLCVVARIQDLLSIERSGAYRGRYFVLGKLLSPLEGIGEEELPLDILRARVTDPDEPVRELLVATPPSVDGEATALLIAQQLRGPDVRVTRLASGVPHGGDLEFADPITIGRAIAGRRGLE